MEQALAQVLRLPVPPATTCAGRTDAGVHARAQVAHVDVPTDRLPDALPGPDLPPRPNLVPGRDLLPGPRQRPGPVPLPLLRRRLAGVLPPDIRVRAAAVAPAGFDARFSALARRYCYRIDDRPEGVDPLLRHVVLAHRRPLSAGAMQRAGQGLLGEHDFAAFCRRRPGASTVRTLLALTCRRDDRGLVLVGIEADAFCHSMVRAIVGALLPVGEGRRSEDWPARVLRAGRRDPAVTVLPAHALVLEEVRYPPDALLADRQAQTRRVRGDQVP